MLPQDLPLPDDGRNLRTTTSKMRVQIPPSRLTFTRSFYSLNMNRIQRYLEESREHPLYGDFVIVAGEFGRFAVTHETARHIRKVLDRWFTPTWIEFADRVGSIIRVRSTHIRSLVESTIEQRAHDRLLDRARDQEEGEGRRPWDNDRF